MNNRDNNFREHSIFLSEIAQNILDGNDTILSTEGVREIIALYLLIPYITKDQLETGMPSKMPKIDLSEEFLNGVKLENLRNAISHSFVTVEQSNPNKLGRIIVDDRAQMNSRGEHNNLTVKTKVVTFEIKPTHEKLKELHLKVINSI